MRRFLIAFWLTLLVIWVLATLAVMNIALARDNARVANIMEQAIPCFRDDGRTEDGRVCDAAARDAKRRVDFMQQAGWLPANPAAGAMADFKANCCGPADAYEADEWRTEPDGTLIAVLTCNEPESCEEYPGKIVRKPGTEIKIAWNQILIPGRPLNNTGHGWVWLGAQGGVICYSHPPGS